MSRRDREFMRITKHWLIGAPFAAGITFTLASFPAHAYIDGGTASMLFQLLAAGALGGIFFIKTFWARVKETLTFWKKKPTADDE